jgi:tetratricopeptide (TPR) repeat protein
MHSAKDLLSIAAGILEGEMQRMAGDLPAAIASFQRAASMQEALVYDEPEPLPFSAYHWLGAALLDAKRFADAEKAYRAELKDHPRNGWSLLGLKQALTGIGAETAAVDDELAASWARADTWIQSSRF